MRKLLRTVLVLGATMNFAIAGQSAEKFEKIYSFANPPGQKLRAFGACATDFSEFASDKGKVWAMKFSAADKEKAGVIAGKLIADLKDSAGVKVVKVKIGDKEVPGLETAAGQVFVISLNGAEVAIFASTDQAVLTSFMADEVDAVANAAADGSHPSFLDRWGWGFYGLGGFNNYHDWMTKADGQKTRKNPIEDVDFIEKYGFHFEPWVQDTKFDNSDGILANTGIKWMIKEAEKRNIPFSFRTYVTAGGADWTARKFPEYMEQPAWFLQSGWHGPKQYWTAQPHLTWFSKDIQRHLAFETKKMMEEFKDSKTNGWMHPHGELTHDPWYDMHCDFSKNARNHWREYLKKQGLSLEELSKMFNCEKTPFTSWDQVPIPEFATFNGLPGKIQSLAGTWYYRLENTPQENQSDDWWKQTAAARYPGLQDKWYQQKLDTSLWKAINMPGSNDIFSILKSKKATDQTTWFRRAFEFHHTLQPDQKVFLYFYPISHISIHSGDHKRYHKFFMNGKEIGEIGQWGALDVTKDLKEGLNEIAFQLHGGVWNGRIFLSTTPPKGYPYLGVSQNRLWQIWNNWRLDAKYEGWRDILDAMRQADPEKPIKFMAPISFRGPRWRKLALNYGGWPHFTGEGQWFFPWYKRYGELYGIPGTSELAGPCNNLKDQFNGYRRVFLAGLDGHEPVFLAQTYTRDKDLRKWWIDHNAVLKRMGKYNIFGPQVLLYRCTRNTTNNNITAYPELGKASRLIQSPWNWDIGRGTLQTLGYSYLYLDDDGIADGKIYGHKVIIDSGNETLDKKSIAGLEDWVKAGGTYVVLPFTGRNSLLEPDSWPINKLTGCEVVKERPVGKGTVIIKKDQDLFKNLAGKTFPDNGKSMDYVGNNLNNLSFELKPGADCQVLATYENGSPAIVRRKLGKGQVITMGSAFWRNAQDRNGIWWPEANETEFIADLLNGLQFDKPLCETDDFLVWSQPYRSNNGLESVATFISWHEDKTVTPTAKMRLPAKPKSLVCYGVDGVKQIPFEWKDGVAEFKLEMPAKEVKIICAETFTPEAAVKHWWNRMNQLWRPLVPSMIDFTKYGEGKWANSTMDLTDKGKFTNDEPGKGWTSPDFNDSKWQDSPLDILNFWGAKPKTKAWVRKSFDIPENWHNEGGEIRLVSACWTRGATYQTPTKMYLNGKVLHDFSNDSYYEFDITQLLNKGKNTVSFEIQPDQEYLGFPNDLYLYHKVPPVKSVDLKGEWQGLNAKEDAIAIELPGKGKIKHPHRKIFIPEDWKGKYQVRLYMTGNKSSILGAWINEQLVRRHHHSFGSICDIDITNHLKFGEDNEFVLANAGDPNGKDTNPKNVPNWDISEMKLELYPVKK